MWSSVRGLDVELGEVRKFLRAVGHSDVESDAARGETVLPQFADCAEIGGAQESDPVVLAPVESSVARLLNAQAGESGPRRQIAGRRVGRHVEIGLFVNDLAGLAALDHMHADRLLEKQPQMEEGDRKGARAIGEQRESVAVFDLAPFLVIDLLKHLGRGTRRRLVGLMRALASLLLEEFVREWDRRLELQSVRLCPQRLGNRSDCRGRGGDPLEERSTVNVIRHDVPFGTPALLA